MNEHNKDSEPVWAKYITEDNLPNADLEYIASVIGIEATKKLILSIHGMSFNIPQNANYRYKKQYIIENYDGTKKSLNNLIKTCDVSARYIYKVIKEHVEGKKD